MNKEIECIICHKTYELEVDAKAYSAWKNGKLIQDAMPNLTPGERELLISGVCEICFHKMFDEDESEEDIEEEVEEYYDPVAEAKKHKEEREALYQALAPSGTSEVKEYKLFTKDEREAQQIIWEHHLPSYCPSDSMGCHPCDNGMPCDSCQYDRWLKLKNAEDIERLGLPLTPDEKELLDEEKARLIKEGEEDQAKRAFYED